ncbi:hypothetical protein VKT23_016753 [Stygiomarasmius scandens]|uniref:Ankyrin repeat protein n=1 Tax=Marasmiellus scandens TaxID=2682957 RepID=A0ABR1ITZ6_9AGAR
MITNRKVIRTETQIANQICKTFEEAKSCEEAEARVKAWLSDPNLTRTHITTIFERAAHFGYTPIVELLIRRGDISDLNGDEGIEAMRHTIFYAGSFPVVQALVKAGYDVNNNISYDGNALRLAVNKNKVDIVKWLLDNGADPLPYPQDDPVYPYSLLILTEAAEKSSPEVISLLVNRGNVPIKHSRALERAAYAGRIENVICLLELGADIDEVADMEMSPMFNNEEKERGEFGNALHVASSEGHLEMVRLLLDKGADPLSKDTRGMTARERARRAGQRQVVALFPESNDSRRFYSTE